jgi:hypothetical protein
MSACLIRHRRTSSDADTITVSFNRNGCKQKPFSLCQQHVPLFLTWLHCIAYALQGKAADVPAAPQEPEAAAAPYSADFVRRRLLVFVGIVVG